MKKKIFVVAMFVLAFAVSGFAKGFFADVVKDAEQIQVEGKVLSVPTPYSGQQGTGMDIDTNLGEITVYGLGPIWYWFKNDVKRPVVGDSVTVALYKLDINGKMYYLLKSITLADGKTLDLRDDSTGEVLWRGGKFKKKMFKKSPNCPYKQQ